MICFGLDDYKLKVALVARSTLRGLIGGRNEIK